jgi:hypothetical protein
MSEMLFFAGRDRRGIREKLEDLEAGDTVRVVSEERDVLARVDEDTQVREDVDVTDRIVETQITVYGDRPCDHVITSLSWWEPGPVMLAWHDHLERVDRLEFK